MREKKKNKTKNTPLKLLFCLVNQGNDKVAENINLGLIINSKG